MTIQQFVRHFAGLGLHLGSKCDGKPRWSGLEKLFLIPRRADAEKKDLGNLDCVAARTMDSIRGQHGAFPTCTTANKVRLHPLLLERALPD